MRKPVSVNVRANRFGIFVASLYAGMGLSFGAVAAYGAINLASKVLRFLFG